MTTIVYRIEIRHLDEGMFEVRWPAFPDAPALIEAPHRLWGQK